MFTAATEARFRKQVQRGGGGTSGKLEAGAPSEEPGGKREGKAAGNDMPAE